MVLTEQTGAVARTKASPISHGSVTMHATPEPCPSIATVVTPAWPQPLLCRWRRTAYMSIRVLFGTGYDDCHEVTQMVIPFVTHVEHFACTQGTRRLRYAATTALGAPS